MGKGSARLGYWPWLIGGLLLVKFMGDDPETKPRESSPSSVTVVQPEKPLSTVDVAKSPRIRLKPVTQTRQPVDLKIAAIPPPSAQAPKPVIKAPEIAPKVFQYVDASRLNVRNGPNKKDKPIWTLKRDQQVEVIARDGVWAKVKGARFQGWVHSGYLTPNKSKPKTKVASRSPSPPAKKSKKRQISKSAIIKILIKRSYAYYSGNCPCPYSRTARGRKCGRRSAYSRPGGASPLCYSSDITASMIQDYRDRQ